jgi:hypothetical protein
VKHGDLGSTMRAGYSGGGRGRRPVRLSQARVRPVLSKADAYFLVFAFKNFKLESSVFYTESRNLKNELGILPGHLSKGAEADVSISVKGELVTTVVCEMLNHRLFAPGLRGLRKPSDDISAKR